jgi:hypothetical protein
MPTAIMPLYTSQGFAIGADRRRRNSKTGEIVDAFKKIFPIPGETLAYAVAGSVGITPDDTDDVVFDFREATRMSVASIPPGSAKTSREYARRLSVSIHARMQQAVSEANKQGRKITYSVDMPHGNAGFVIAHLFVIGYCEDRPGLECVAFWHKDQDGQVSAPISSLRQGYPYEFPWAGYGSAEIFKRLYVTEDRQFADFIGPKPAILDALTLGDAVEVAKRYVLACQTPLARQLDPRMCESIGGRPQIVRITLTDGFQPEKGFEPPEENQAF